eukprot:TRINITY_DN10161_c0_g1_i1.p1 TRINITY_DN10161_c0_g1~~TRINITY_DN10161_c0_g1_i1.p1  ORF type:complete len:549 (+),score=187.75 TRINITY_DN10161_c0_g1_i1:192-1649(+)
MEIIANKMGLEDVKDYEGKRIVMRVDYNVPMDNERKITDPIRIVSTIPTIKYLLEHKVKSIVLLAHFQEPYVTCKRENFSLRPCLEVLQQKLGENVPVEFLDDCVGDEVTEKVKNCKAGSVFLCENVRFHVEEIGEMAKDAPKKKDKKEAKKEEKKEEAPKKEEKEVKVDDDKVKATPEERKKFAEALASLGDIYVNEAFGAAHRPHTSVSLIPLPIKVAGLCLKKEMDVFSHVMSAPHRPFLGIMGGAKVKDKIKVIMNLLDIVDALFIGGGMAYTFNKVNRGMAIGESLFDADGAKKVPEIMAKAAEKGVKIFFPVDNIISDKFDNNARFGQVEGDIPNGWMGVDIGPKSRVILSTLISKANTVLWNGPVGAFELAAARGGTMAAMFDLSMAKKRGCNVILGGGDTGSASLSIYVGDKPASEQMTWVSTGGGSSLVLMEGSLLPAIEALSDKTSKVESKPTATSSSSSNSAAIKETKEVKKDA